MRLSLRNFAAVLLALLVALPLLAAPAHAAPQSVAYTQASATLKPGMTGPAVKNMQSRLLQLGYWLPSADGSYGPGTRQAVIALQKAAGLSRDGVAGPATQRALAAGVRPTARSKSGRVLEVDKSKQLLLVVNNGKVVKVFAVSTGSGKRYRTSTGGTALAVTPSGKFKITRQVNGIRRAPLGNLYRPKYFNGGIAFHGYSSVPVYPASHGCVRLTNAAMDHVWAASLAPIGTPVWVY